MAIEDLLRQGIALQQAGKLEQAAGLYKQVLAENPRQVNALQLMGQAALQSGRLALAQQLLERALDIKPDLGPAWRDLGYLANAQSNSARARECLVRAVKLMPDDAGLNNDLGALLNQLGEFDASIMYFEAAIALNPGDPAPHSNLAMSLRQASRPLEARAACEKAIALAPDFAKAHATLGMTLRDLGEPAAAVEAFDRALELAPEFAPGHAFRAAALLECGDAREALRAADACLRIEPANRSALAFRGIALGELGMVDERARLLNFDAFVRRAKVSAPPGFDRLERFNEALAEHAQSHPTLVYEPGSKATRSGSQTGNLLEGAKGPVAVLEDLIREAVAAYFAALPSDPSHPYARIRLPAWELVAWATVLGKQGHQQPHIHPGGWLSGVYYVQVPEFSGIAEEKPGWIEFGGAPETFVLTRKAAKMRYQPEPGLMLLFPSYFYHSTIPYENDATRISIAFDVIPRMA